MSEIKKVRRECPFCDNVSEVLIPKAAYKKWRAGEALQRAWPEGAASDREILISGICYYCQDEVFGDEQ